MDSAEYTQPTNKNNRNSISATLESNIKRSAGLSRAKFAVGQFVRKTLLYRRPLHKRASNTGRTGFVLPGDCHGDSVVSLERRFSQQSDITVRSFHSQATRRSRRSVVSVQSVKVFGTPQIFLTHPTAQGRRSHVIHRSSDIEVPPKVAGTKRLRYSHPTATAVIDYSAWIDEMNKSKESLSASLMLPDPESRLGTPKTIDMTRDFPGEVNVRKIARDSAFAYEEAKDLVDGVKLRSSMKQAIAVPQYQAYSRRGSAINGETEVQHNRQAALDALNGAVVSPSTLPGILLPGPPQLSRVSFSSYLPSNIDGKAVHGGRSSMSAERPKYVKHDSLSFIPYAKFLDRQPSTTAANRLSVASISPADGRSERDSMQAVRHKQVYASVEDLSTAFPSFDGSLNAAMLGAVAEELECSGGADQVKLNVPKPHEMNENGFPVMKSPRQSYSAKPDYKKRTLSIDEVKVTKKEEKRKSKHADQDGVPARKASRVESASFMQRMRNGFA